MLCVSSECPKFSICKRARGAGQAIALATYGSGSVVGEDLVIQYVCGPSGGYALFERSRAEEDSKPWGL